MSIIWPTIDLQKKRFFGFCGPHLDRGLQWIDYLARIGTLTLLLGVSVNRIRVGAQYICVGGGEERRCGRAG